MASQIGIRLNEVPNRASVLRLAGEQPSEAREVIRSIEHTAKGVGSNMPAEFLRQIDTVMASSDADLAEALRTSPLFQNIFPDVEAQSFTEVVAQIQRPETIGWEAAAVGQASFTGVARRDEGGGYVLNVDGREFGLETSTRMQNNISPGLSAAWLEGFLRDGADQLITIQGEVSESGRDILVEGYMPGSTDDFVFGRVHVYSPTGDELQQVSGEIREQAIQSGRVTVQTARGEVEVTNPELKRQLAHLPRLGVILPVSTSTVDGREVIASNVPDYYALGGRFQSTTENPATDLGNGVYSSNGAAAYDNFIGPFEVSGGDGAKWRLENNGGQRNVSVQGRG